MSLKQGMNRVNLIQVLSWTFCFDVFQPGLALYREVLKAGHGQLSCFWLVLVCFDCTTAHSRSMNRFSIITALFPFTLSDSSWSLIHEQARYDLVMMMVVLRVFYRESIFILICIWAIQKKVKLVSMQTWHCPSLWMFSSDMNQHFVLALQWEH